MTSLPAVKRELCEGCARTRFECWRFPCPLLNDRLRDIRRNPEVLTRARQWAAEGGFDLYQDRLGNWPIARPRFMVGDGAHYEFNGDAYPATVIDVSPGEANIIVRRDRVVRKGFFVIDPAGEVKTFTRRKDGAYRSKGDRTWTLDLGRESTWNREF